MYGFQNLKMENYNKFIYKFSVRVQIQFHFKSFKINVMIKVHSTKH